MTDASATKLRYYNVFVPGGAPQYTYNPRSDRALEIKVKSVLQNLCKLVVVTGNTKSGKTVLVEKILPRDFAIWIDGGGVKDEDDFWSTILGQTDIFPVTALHISEGSTAEDAGEISVEGDALFVKAAGKALAKIADSKTASTVGERLVSPRSAAVTALRMVRKPLVIDDFHYLDKALQGDIIRALKPLVYAGVPVVIIAIPHRRYDAVKVEKEMTGRFLEVGIPAWSDEELRFIPEKGFTVLGVTPDPVAVDQMVEQSMGSPHLMQQFCREVCEISQIATGHETDSDTIVSNAPGEAFPKVAETIGRPIFEKLAKGPRQRSDRKERQLKNGKIVDIYNLVLHGLAELKPGMVTLEYEHLRTAIKDICHPTDVPNVSEIARVLKKMSEIALSDNSSTPVLDFDEDEKRLHVTDPFFAFYLRWGSLEKEKQSFSQVELL